MISQFEENMTCCPVTSSRSPDKNAVAITIRNRCGIFLRFPSRFPCSLVDLLEHKTFPMMRIFFNYKPFVAC